MNAVSVEEVKRFVSARLQQVTSNQSGLAEDFDFLQSGALDSLGVVDLIVAVERQFAIEIDLAELDADQLTIVGPFCRYVAGRSHRTTSSGAPAPMPDGLSQPARSEI